MRTKKRLVLALAVVAIAFGSAAAVADYLEIERLPPGETQCICPANWDPVVCKAADGTRRAFSNACVAACNGFTKCASFVVIGP